VGCEGAWLALASREPYTLKLITRKAGSATVISSGHNSIFVNNHHTEPALFSIVLSPKPKPTLPDECSTILPPLYLLSTTKKNNKKHTQKVLWYIVPRYYIPSLDSDQNCPFTIKKLDKSWKKDRITILLGQKIY